LFVDHIFPFTISEYLQIRYQKCGIFRWMSALFISLLERSVLVGIFVSSLSRGKPLVHDTTSHTSLLLRRPPGTDDHGGNLLGQDANFS